MKEVRRLIQTINRIRQRPRLTQVQQQKLDDARRDLAIALTRLSE